ncbi:MAG TPA: PHB depolymerase family esterase, partial [Phaeodactylibacter sp.]|nr:PHB depolymerase family esterase [Phaeodactylibacter sp.]
MAASLSEVNPEAEGTYTTVPITHDGLNRSYDIYVPPSYTGEEAVPMVMTLHGYTGTSKLTAWQTRMNEVADTAGFIVVYPQGQLVTQPIPPPGLPPVAPGWNTPGFVSTTDDVGFLLSVLEDVTGAYNIDEAAAYLCGISNGAGMTDVMSGAAPERFAAVGEVASVAITPRDHLVPTMIVRGTDDPLVPYDGFPQIGIPSTEQAVAHYGRLNGCTLTPDSLDLEDIDPTDNTTVTRFTYTDCYGNADLVFYRVNGGSHVWDDGPPAPVLFQPVIGPNVNRDFSVSATLWNFFKQHRLPHARLLSQTLEDQDSTRNYLLYVPAAYDGTEEWPLVLNLHGGFNDRFVQMWNSRMNLVADTAQFLVAYPEGHLQEDGRVWNTQEQPALPDDVAYLSRLIDTLTANYAINAERVYSAGFSMGGEMSYLLGCNIPDQVAAIASVSGPTLTDNDWTCTAGQPLPLLHMHGTADIVAPIEGGTGVPNGFDFPAVRDQLDFWINANGCAADSTVTQLPDTNPEDNSTVTLTRFDDCALYQGADGNNRTAEVWYYQVEGGGHSWPDGRFDFLPPAFQPLFSPVNRDINASSEIWNFFNRHRLLLTNTNAITPAAYAVEVFPNPAQEAFQLSFELPAAAPVQVQLFNAIGQAVHQRRLGTLGAGPQQVHINQLGALPAGLYYYRLQIGAGQVSGPVMIRPKP